MPFDRFLVEPVHVSALGSSRTEASRGFLAVPMFPRRRSLDLFCFVSVAVVLLFFIRPSPRIHIPKTIQFEHQNGSFEDQLFSLFSQLGVARSLHRVPVLNSAGDNFKLVRSLSGTIASRFPMILQQFKIVIEPDHPPNAELGSQDSFEDPVEKLSEYIVPDMMVRGNGFRSYKYFHHIRPEVRQWMLGSAENVREARSLLPDHQRDVFKICVHTSENIKNLVDFKLILAGLHWILTKYGKENERLLMVISSNRTSISREISDSAALSKFNFEKLYLISSPPEVQLTFSRLYCDTVLLTVPSSKFGFWMGYLAKGENNPVYYMNYEDVDRNDFTPPEWKKVAWKEV